MRIILEAYNEYITLENYEDTYRKSIELFLRKDYDIHKETIAYWSCGNEDLTDCFAISSFMFNNPSFHDYSTFFNDYM
mgnify:CR=1 FL=1